jgi:hypothetical protein
MKRIITNNLGEKEIDPYDNKGKHEKWLKSITNPDGSIDYRTVANISANSSELITRFALDMTYGRNLAKGTRKGKRSYNHLVNIRGRLVYLCNLLETRYKKELIALNEDDILTFFNMMREGTILRKDGKPFLSVSTYAKAFSAFWRWIVRVKRKENIAIPDIVLDLDTSQGRKPSWTYFNLQDVEKMADAAKSLYYKALLFFLFDSGIRAPKELMNTRVKDITPVPNTDYLFLQVREETSKTFGRKIKLMISSNVLKRYIASRNFQPDDFLFDKDYVSSSRIIARLGCDVLKVGVSRIQPKTSKVLVKGGITMYDFRHNSVCHYLPIYRSENQMKYRYGWKKSEMIHYYSEFIGMKDTISDDDMLVDTTKTQIQQDLEREKMRVAFLEEQVSNQKKEMEDRIKQLEAMMLQRFAENF